MNEVGSGIYKFGPFHIDLEQRVLFRSGVAVSLTQKAFDTLAILVARQGKVVDKSELMSLVWQGTFVEENNLTQNVSALRKVLGDGEYIETIPRRGYRFVMAVEVMPAVSVPADSESTQFPSRQMLRPRWVWGVLSVPIIGAVGFFASVAFNNRGRPDPPIDSLRGLPFV